ncbi:AAA family ATPase, partial [Candidatus Woesearchaeota archaeon]|nr:AAA family ATPase [Candidatus Woesearchaeota archaeon]
TEPKEEEKKKSILDTIANVSQSLKKKIGIDYSADIRKKLHGLYDLIQDRALYIAPEKNIQFGLAKSFPLNDNESENIDIYEKGYNAPLLLSILVGLVEKGTMISFGPPGAGKTTSAEIVGHFIYDQSINNIFNATIYGNPELTREEMIARLHTGKLMHGIEEVIQREFTDSPVKILDEINRIPPGTLSSLYQTIDRGLAKYYEKVIMLKDGPIYATANAPDSGNWPLPPPVRDRFDIAVVAGELNPTFISHLTRGGSITDRLNIPKELKLEVGSHKIVREAINDVDIESEAMNQLIFFISMMNYCDQAGIDPAYKTKANAMVMKPGRQLCGKCHYKNSICAYTEEAISPRSYKAIVTYAKALAWWRGKKTADVEDIKQIAPYAVWHKLTLTDQAKKKNQQYVNARIEFVKECFEESQKIYNQSKASVPKLGEIISSIVKSYDLICKKDSNGGFSDDEKLKLKAEIEGHFGEIKKLDTIAKWPIAVGLKFVYERIK